MNRSNAVKAIKSAIEEQLDNLVQNGDVELSRFDLEDITREAAYQALDDQMIWTEDVVSLWQSCGMPESPTGEGDILTQMQDGLYEVILGDLDIEDMILDYISDNKARLCTSTQDAFRRSASVSDGLAQSCSTGRD